MADEPALFTKAQPETTGYFDRKGQQPSFAWTDVAPEEHALTWTVAKTSGFDVLDDIRAGVDAAIRDSVEFGDFADRMEPILRKKGWWGRASVLDPLSGEMVNAQLGSLHRLRTIYWANVSSARAAGEWERIQRTKRGLPFLIYEQSIAERKRPEHLSWVGVILPVDHPWWATHYPPNGWLCRCRVRQISRREAERLGYDPEKGGPQIVTRPYRNKRTGETMQVPRGIDPGWQTNPGIGRARNVEDHLGGRLGAMTPERQRTAVADIVGSAKSRAIIERRIPFDRSAWGDTANRARGNLSVPVAAVPETQATAMGSSARRIDFSVRDGTKQAEKGRVSGGSDEVRPEDYLLVQRAIDEGRLFESKKGQRTYLFELVDGDRAWMAVVMRTLGGDELFLRSFHRIRRRHLGRSGVELDLER